MLGFCSPAAAGSPPAETTPEPFRSLQIATTAAAATTKKKRRPAGTPDPDAEVVSLSPRTLLESDRYVCEICGQGFQRDQNLQMHRRRHKVPWKLLKREAGEAARKRVFVCPEPSCLHHDPAHALGDLVGIKKHFRRKHSGHRQWACARCSKAYAVHSDYKAHLKTCGTRGHSCDCGRVFSRAKTNNDGILDFLCVREEMQAIRPAGALVTTAPALALVRSPFGMVESFIEHQDTCNAGRARPDLSSPACAGGGGATAPAGSSLHHQQAPASLSRTASSTSPSSDIVIGQPAAWPGPPPPMPSPTTAAFPAHRFDQAPSPPPEHRGGHNLELQLMPPYSSSSTLTPRSPAFSSQGNDAAAATHLALSIGVGGGEATRASDEMASSSSCGRRWRRRRRRTRRARRRGGTRSWPSRS
ncbi:hypothetical protein PR202_ga15683 [Eleusine coracana subsp. coracana]|uniref:C2H2-type domain-containing protein n=1 Tax=Eleusine coracana subsp. coracana TaxID=191504 RepID=A0AAV5CKH6_ELECO|nr:hypothetical protein PR202_ga15683 [Eleusine coracana subsp. coracana]